MGATTPRLAKVKGPRGEVRVNSEKRWLKGTPKTKMPADEAGTHRKLRVGYQLATVRQIAEICTLERVIFIIEFCSNLVIERPLTQWFGFDLGLFFNVGQT